jgi:hypothetical protein
MEAGVRLWIRLQEAATTIHFLPILVSLAAICLLMFLFLIPSFEPDDAVSATSDRPGAEASIRVQGKNKSMQSQRA